MWTLLEDRAFRFNILTIFYLGLRLQNLQNKRQGIDKMYFSLSSALGQLINDSWRSIQNIQTFSYVSVMLAHNLVVTFHSQCKYFDLFLFFFFSAFAEWWSVHLLKNTILTLPKCCSKQHFSMESLFFKFS